MRLEFSTFTTIPVALIYLSINAKKASIFLIDPSPNKRTSSRNRVWVTSSVDETLMPFIAPYAFALWIILLRASATNKKMKGESGHPCLSPLVGLKNLDADPLIITANDVDCKHPIVHSTTYNATPIFISSNLTKV